MMPHLGDKSQCFACAHPGERRDERLPRRMAELHELVNLVARLRGDEGCPWDRAQTLRSMRPFLLEETHEVLEALDAAPTTPGTPAPALEGELGDLLFNVLMLIQIAEDGGHTSRGAVVQRIVDKMIRRHPHVFPVDGADPEHLDGPSLARWEAVKAKERGQGSRLDGIPAGAPALMRAHRQGQKAAGVGFDWPDVAGVLDKVDEEVAELKEAIAQGDRTAVESELGDVLHSLASVGRHLKTPAEDALRGSIARFDARFRAMEAVALERGDALEGLDVQALETMWQDAKRRLAEPPPRSD